MKKNYLQGKSVQENLVNGVNKLANLVKLTLGPKGKNVVIDKGFAVPPLITNDGVTIAKNFELNDKYENIGVKLIKEVSQKTNDLAGDGTTTATVLAQKMLNEGLKQLHNEYNPIIINNGIDKALEFCIKVLNNKSKKIASNKEIENVATISCQDKYVGSLIAKAYNKLGRDGTIILQDSSTANTTLHFQEGLSISKGFASPYFCNNAEKSQVNFEDCLLLVTDIKLNNFNRLLPLLSQVVRENKPIVIICDDIENETLSSLVLNKMKGNFMCCVVKAPLYGEKKLALLEDIACVCSTEVFSNTSNKKLEELTLEDLGKLKQIKITIDSTTIISKNTDKHRIENRKNLIKNQIENCNIDYDKEQLELRLSNLVSGVASIQVGSESEVEQKEKKLRIEDAIYATKSALSSGVLPGGGLALFRLTNDLKKYIKKLSHEEKIGAEIVLNSLSEPLKQIVKNSGENEEVVINKLKSKKIYDFGFNALTNTYCNLISSGIIDPAKVTITALKLATSVVKMMLTTEGIICEDYETE